MAYMQVLMGPMGRGWGIKAYILKALAALLGRIEPDTMARLGATCGALAWQIGLRRQVVSDNLRLALELRGTRRRMCARRAYRAMGASMCQLWSYAVRGPAAWAAGVEVLNPQWARHVHHDHGAVVGICAHLGNWDVLAAWGARQLHGLQVYATPQRDPHFDAVLNAARRGMGMDVVLVRQEERRGALRLLRGLRRRQQSVGLLADQGPRRQYGEPAWFFHEPTWCHDGPVVLAQRSGLSIVPYCCVRRGWNRHAIFVGRPYDPAGQDPVLVRQRCMDQLAALIACCPGQYFWHHRRFKYRIDDMPRRHTRPWVSERRALLA